MNSLSAELLIIILVFLIALSGFFSTSETAMMAINRYRLRHLARKHHSSAIRVSQLLEQPDRLLGVILIGNTCANIFAATVATVLAVRYWDELGVTITTLALTFIVLIFAEITPKILAALYPERIAFLVARPLKILLKILYPLVWMTTAIANGLLRILRLEKTEHKLDLLTHEELRTIVHEALGKSPGRSQEMLLSILDLGKATVEDIMVPRNEIIGIDLDDQWPTILTKIQKIQHTRIPIYHGSIDDIKGILHIRKVMHLLIENKLTKEDLLQSADQVYFIPEGVALNNQLLNFQQQKIRTGLVVNEYGDIQGLVTLEDILEEIVGQFTTDFSDSADEIIVEKKGCYLISGGINIRDLNRELAWHLPANGPKTLNGLILEYLQTIPHTAVCLNIAGYRMEILKIEGNFVRRVKIFSPDFT